MNKKSPYLLIFLVAEILTFTSYAMNNDANDNQQAQQNQIQARRNKFLGFCALLAAAGAIGSISAYSYGILQAPEFQPPGHCIDPDEQNIEGKCFDVIIPPFGSCILYMRSKCHFPIQNIKTAAELNQFINNQLKEFNAAGCVEIMGCEKPITCENDSFASSKKYYQHKCTNSSFSQAKQKYAQQKFRQKQFKHKHR